MMNEKQICAGNIAIGDITFMCRLAMLPMMKRGNEGWVKSKLPFRELSRSINVCIQFMLAKRQHFPCDSNS
jgi:hypothetical protein